MNNMPYAMAEADEQNAPDTFPAAHHRIVALSVTGGFLDGLRLDFTDGLNCIIGGRGTGKTTVLEFIRYLLCADDAQDRGKANREAKDHDSVMHAIKLGATNFKRKPLSLDEKMEEIVRRDLADCGRKNHEDCAAINAKLAILLGARQAGRNTERYDQLKKIVEIKDAQLRATLTSPRTRSELVDRLRDGKF